MLKPIECKVLDGGRVLTCEGRLSFVRFLQEGDPEKDGKYGAAIMFPPDSDLTLLKGAIAAEAKAKAPGGKVPAGFKNPILDMYTLQNKDIEDEAEHNTEWKGWKLIRCNSKFKPTVVDSQLKDVTDPAQIYPGRWARFSVAPRFYAKSDVKEAAKDGVALYLTAVMLLRNDTPTFKSGGPDLAKDFSGVAPQEDASKADDFDL